MKAAPAIADRIMPSQIGGSGSFMCVVGCAGGGTQRGLLGLIFKFLQHSHRFSAALFTIVVE